MADRTTASPPSIGRRIRRRLRPVVHATVARLPDRLAERVAAALARRRILRSYARELVPAAELEATYTTALESLLADGVGIDGHDYLEFGVCHGTSMRCMHRALTRVGPLGVRLFGFDSFRGLPPEAADDDGGVWRAGRFAADMDRTTRLLTDEGVDWERTFLVEGWFDETLTPELLADHAMARRAVIVMVDCDTYRSAKQALDFCASALADRAVVFFDDWDSGGGLAAKGLGEKRAFDEFLAAHPGFTATERQDLRYTEHARAFVLTRRIEGSPAPIV